MSFVEFIGFIITLAAMAVIVAKKSWEERDRKNHPEKYKAKERSRQADLKKLLKSMEIDLEEEEEEEEVVKPLSIPPKPKSGVYRGLSTSIEKREFKSAIQEQTDAYTIKKLDEKVCRGKKVIRDLHSKKDMMILYEIVSKPKALH